MLVLVKSYVWLVLLWLLLFKICFCQAHSWWQGLSTNMRSFAVCLKRKATEFNHICLRDGCNQMAEFTKFFEWVHIIMIKWENIYYKDKGDGLQYIIRRNLLLKLCLLIKINKQKKFKKKVLRLYVVRVVKQSDDDWSNKPNNII